MTREDLDKILKNHKLWIHGKEGGEVAEFRGADLSYAILKNTVFVDADLSSANLKDVYFCEADLTGANLRDADLKGAVFKNTNFKNTNIDFSCLPLWCGSLSAHFDDKQLIQIAYHLVRAGLKSKNASDETKKELSKLIDFANKFHRVNECGKILKEDEK